MRKSALFVFILLINSNSYSQDSVLLVMHLKPLLNYYQVSSQKMHMEVSYAQDDTTSEKEKEMSLNRPKINDMSNTMTLMTRTGALNSEEKMPVEIEYLKSSNQDSNEIIPSGTKIFGTAAIDKQPVYDSISDIPGREEYRKSLLKTMQSLLSQIQLPNKKMAPGDEFTKETPLTMNIGGINLNIIYTQTYKLISASAETANFDLAVKYTMKIESDQIPDMPMSGGGTGGGSLLLDRINEYPLKYELHYDMNFGLKIDNAAVNALLSASFIQDITITKK